MFSAPLSSGLLPATLSAQAVRTIPCRHRTAEPVSLEEVGRSLTLLPVSRICCRNTVMDFLRFDPSLDLQQRAPNGMQSDVSIRGAGYGQTLVLLNGQRLNDVQSGHHNMDLPSPSNRQPHRGAARAGSTLYGSDAIGGVINIITAPQEPPSPPPQRPGNFGVNQERA